MSDMHKILVLAGVVLAGWLVYLLAPILTPFLLAGLLAYLGDPVTDRLQQLKLSRTAAVTVVFIIMLLVFLAALLILIPMIQDQAISLIKRFPELIDWVERELFPFLSTQLGVDPGNINLESLRETLRENWQDIGNVAGFMYNSIAGSGQVLLSWVAYLLLIPVVTFYLLRDWDVLMENIGSAIPVRYRETVQRLARNCDDILSEFLRGQLLVMFSLALIYTTGLWLIGLEFALLIGLVAGLVSFVPYLGTIVGVCAALIAAFMQFHDVIHLVYVALIFGVGQALEGMVLSPWLVGDRIGLHPVAVIFAVMAGGQLFGFVGVLLALPVAAVCMVLLKFIYAQYRESDLHRA